MRIGVCQTPEILGNVDAAVEVVRGFAERAATAEVDLLVFPECFLQGYRVAEEHVHGQALEFGSEDFDAVLAGLEGFRPVLVLDVIERAGHRYYNTAAVIETGRVVGRYRKSARQPLLARASRSPHVGACRAVRRAREAVLTEHGMRLPY